VLIVLGDIVKQHGHHSKSETKLLDLRASKARRFEDLVGVKSIRQENLQGIFLVSVSDTQESNIPLNIGFVGGGEDKVDSAPVPLMVGDISFRVLPARSAASN
jgi:hypothetical protein